LRYYKKNIAVLIFALSQEEEIKRKPFLRNTSLQQDLTSHTLTEVKKTGLDYYVYDEQHQVGTSFGERFTNAITDIYNKGYEAVISVGNDTPNLTNIHVHKAGFFTRFRSSIRYNRGIQSASFFITKNKKKITTNTPARKNDMDKFKHIVRIYFP